MTKPGREPTITTRWYSEDVLQCFHGDVRVGEAAWNGGEWIFWAIDPSDGEVDTMYSSGEWIEVDPPQERHMREVREANALIEHDAAREAANAALNARRRAFRDDENMRDLVRLRAKQLARTYLRQSNQVKEVS